MVRDLSQKVKRAAISGGKAGHAQGRKGEDKADFCNLSHFLQPAACGKQEWRNEPLSFVLRFWRPSQRILTVRTWLLRSVTAMNFQFLLQLDYLRPFQEFLQWGFEQLHPVPPWGSWSPQDGPFSSKKPQQLFKKEPQKSFHWLQ